MASQDLLADRYGAPPPWRGRALVAAILAVVLLFGGWLAWTTWSHSDPAVDLSLETWSIDSEHAASATVIVRLRDDSVEATCLLRAIAEDHAVVGEASFVPTAADSGRRQTVTVRTERRATAVEPVGCTADGQPRPR